MSGAAPAAAGPGSGPSTHVPATEVSAPLPGRRQRAQVGRELCCSPAGQRGPFPGAVRGSPMAHSMAGTCRCSWAYLLAKGPRTWKEAECLASLLCSSEHASPMNPLERWAPGLHFPDADMSGVAAGWWGTREDAPTQQEGPSGLCPSCLAPFLARLQEAGQGGDRHGSPRTRPHSSSSQSQDGGS